MHPLLEKQLAALNIDANAVPDRDAWLALLRDVAGTYANLLDTPQPAEDTAAGDLRHELKTPLSSIRGFAEAVAQDASMDAETRTRFLGLIVQEADRLLKIINSRVR
jgi:signal transduction histidine kinase